MMDERELLKKLFASIDRHEELRKLSDKELAEELLNRIWSEIDIFSYESDLVEEVMRRLENDND